MPPKTRRKPKPTPDAPQPPAFAPPHCGQLAMLDALEEAAQLLARPDGQPGLDTIVRIAANDLRRFYWLQANRGITDREIWEPILEASTPR